MSNAENNVENTNKSQRAGGGYGVNRSAFGNKQPGVRGISQRRGARPYFIIG